MVVGTGVVIDGQLKFEWCAEWKDWHEFHKSAEIIALVAKCEKMLAQRTERRPKELMDTQMATATVML